MRLSSMMLKRLLLAGNNFTAIAAFIFSDYFNKLLINEKCGDTDLIKLVFDFIATFLLYQKDPTIDHERNKILSIRRLSSF